jgi:hypothetical protein
MLHCFKFSTSADCQRPDSNDGIVNARNFKDWIFNNHFSYIIIHSRTAEAFFLFSLI